MSTPDRAITLDLLKKYDRPGPRYTSYPTAVEFHERFKGEDYDRKLAEANGVDEPLSLYVHLPFCEARCSFCGCHVVITKKRDVTHKYLDYLEREIDVVAAKLPDRRRVMQYHWGGGTPTYQTVHEMKSLFEKTASHFTFDDDAEIAIEVDPRVTTPEQIDTLKLLGFNRLSMGVQDFDPKVQEAINRNQSEDQTRALYKYSRNAGFESINLDLIYGLPLQSPVSFGRSLEAVLDLRPDRVALYSFAFVPWIKGNQRNFTEEMLPKAEEKLELFHLALDAFLGAGYMQIGMDHFALPDDELSTALAGRKLHRNFMGYTTKPASDMIGLGISSIGDVRGAFVQSEKKLSRYYDALDAGRLPVHRGFELDDDDKIRRHVITQLMCNFHLSRSDVSERFQISFDNYFRREIDELDGPLKHGFLTITDDTFEVTPLGRFFIRNICMIFDKYLRDKQGDAPVFSKTI